MSDRDKNAVFTQAPAVVQQSVQQARVDDDLAIDVPVDLAPLPSKGLVYPVGSPFYGKELVEFRAMTTREEDILTNRAFIKQGTVVNEVVKSCLVEKSFNVLDMLNGDKNAIMVAIRASGYGAEYEAEVTCSECGAKRSHKFNLATLKAQNLKIEPVEEGVNLFKFQLPRTTINGKPVVVMFKFMTGKDELEIAQTRDKQAKIGLQQAGLVTSALQYSIQSVNGVTDKARIATFISKLSPADSLALRNYISENEPGIIMKQDYACAACGHVEEVVIPVGTTFFWPNS